MYETYSSRKNRDLSSPRLWIHLRQEDIGEVFDNLNSKYDNNIAGALIFTDGQINQGPLLSKFYNYKKNPIYIVGIGDTIPMLDISIQSID